MRGSTHTDDRAGRPGLGERSSQRAYACVKVALGKGTRRQKRGRRALRHKELAHHWTARVGATPQLEEEVVEGDRHMFTPQDMRWVRYNTWAGQWQREEQCGSDVDVADQEVRSAAPVNGGACGTGSDRFDPRLCPQGSGSCSAAGARFGGQEAGRCAQICSHRNQTCNARQLVVQLARPDMHIQCFCRPRLGFRCVRCGHTHTPNDGQEVDESGPTVEKLELRQMDDSRSQP